MFCADEYVATSIKSYIFTHPPGLWCFQICHIAPACIVGSNTCSVSAVSDTEAAHLLQTGHLGLYLCHFLIHARDFLLDPTGHYKHDACL